MIREKCDECGGKLIHKKVDFISNDVNLGKFLAEVCIKCGEEVFDEKASLLIENAAKQKGVWGYGRKMALTQHND